MNTPPFTITGYTAEGLPILENSEWYQKVLDSLRGSKSSRGTPTAEELDERCTEAARRNGELR